MTAAQTVVCPSAVNTATDKLLASRQIPATVSPTNPPHHSTVSQKRTFRTLNSHKNKSILIISVDLIRLKFDKKTPSSCEFILTVL